MNNWVSYSDGLPNVIVSELEIHYPTAKLRAGTYGRGLWEADLYQTDNLPIANFTSTEKTICMGNNVSFQNESFNNSQVLNWIFEGGNPNISSDENPTVNYPNSGTFDVTLIVQNNQGIDTLTIANYITVNAKNIDPIPYYQDFETIGALPVGWSIKNFDGLMTWEKINVSGNWAMVVRNYEYETEYQKDQFITNHYNVNAGSIAILKFDVAYSPYPGFADSLNVYYSNDCNVTLNRIYSKGGNILRTTTTTSQGYFIPTNDEWRTETVELSQFTTDQEINLVFENVSGYGNNLYIDNIRFETFSSVAEIKQKEKPSIFPNPFSQKVSIKTAQNEATVKLFSVNGKLILTQKIYDNITILDLANLNDGIYFAEITIGDITYREKLVKTQN
jgi:PKD repeat protein